MGIVSLYLVSFVRDTYTANLQGSLDRQARLVGERASVVLSGASRDEAQLQPLIDDLGQIAGVRVSVIGSDGSVIADSVRTPSQLPLQLGRSEVRAVLSQLDSGSVGVGSPLEGSSGQQMLYAVAPVTTSDGVVAVVRVAVPSSRVQPDINRLIARIAVAAVLVGLLSVGAGYFSFAIHRAPCAQSLRGRIGSLRGISGIGYYRHLRTKRRSWQTPSTAWQTRSGVC